MKTLKTCGIIENLLHQKLPVLKLITFHCYFYLVEEYSLQLSKITVNGG